MSKECQTWSNWRGDGGKAEEEEERWGEECERKEKIVSFFEDHLQTCETSNESNFLKRRSFL